MGHSSPDAIGRGQIRCERPCPRRCLFGEHVGVEVGDDDARALLGQQVRDRLTDTVRSGGDKRSLSF